MERQSAESGFALLISLIVVGVVLSVGFAVLDLSIKQVRLSTNAKDSEIAFHAANAGMECAQYWRRAESDAMENGQSLTPSCFGVSAGTIGPNSPSPTITADSDGEVFLYEYSFTWGPGSDRCTEVSSLVASTTLLGRGVTTTNMTSYMPGYPDVDNTNSKYCEAGARCSVLSVRGYNKPCNSTTGYGVVQREVLLQF